ncbi:hypothetical protein D0B54_17575 [Solimonas sp. K1W22B-7]|uniref:hypothetical protein n=1 Tax=Solimonas sp. K1W22B-7 TaxID=2303331 RepID=UPI000E337691|nr:hypothetical protein [Solimonas sp. K1W22B-7]AXQ30371.1 hypothetical protein D0B54_17575 [Solimonas sp. K1W22B-7]
MRALHSVGLGLLLWAIFGLFCSYQAGELYFQQRADSRRMQQEIMADHASYSALLVEQGFEPPPTPELDPWAERLDTWAAQLPIPQLAVWLGCTLPPALLALWRMLRALRTARQIEDVPTSRLRGAAQGFVELHGRAAALPQEQELRAPLSGDECVWWACQVFRQEGIGDKKHWRMTRDDRSEQPFLVDDGSGLALVLPSGADAASVAWRSWQPSSDTRYVEGVVHAGDPLYVLGELRTLRAPWSGAPEPAAAWLPQVEAMAGQRFPEGGEQPGANTLALPRDGRRFIFSTQPQASLVSGERWAAALCLLLFLALTPPALMALVGAWGHIEYYYLS